MNRKPELAGKDLYVKNISPEATEEELRRLFSVCGRVTGIHMIRDAGSGVFVGCAYVSMSSAGEAQDAVVTLDEALLIDRTIRVSAARPRAPKPRRPGTSSPGSRRAPSGRGRSA